MRKRRQGIALMRVRALAQHLDGEDLPIFVCNAVLPSVRTKFVVFEPRYRLMMQRVLRGSKEFGMCLGVDAFPEVPRASSPANSKGYCDVGTLLKIVDHQTTPDGMILIEVIGVRRFKVTAAGVSSGLEETTQEQAEYNTATVEWLDDDDGEDQQNVAKLTSEAHTKFEAVHTKLVRSFPDQAASYFLAKIHGTDKFAKLAKGMLDSNDAESAFVADLKLLSDSPAQFVWKCLDALPVPEQMKYVLMRMVSLVDRLRSLLQIMEAVLQVPFEREGSEGEAPVAEAPAGFVLDGDGNDNDGEEIID